jgi:hypothetical protein
LKFWNYDSKTVQSSEENSINDKDTQKTPSNARAIHKESKSVQMQLFAMESARQKEV